MTPRGKKAAAKAAHRIVVNGVETKVTVPANTQRREAMRVALVQTGNDGARDLEEWQLRDSEGVWLPPDGAIGEPDPQRSPLYLNLGAGVNG